jgi:hypothetical protein
MTSPSHASNKTTAGTFTASANNSPSQGKKSIVNNPKGITVRNASPKEAEKIKVEKIEFKKGIDNVINLMNQLDISKDKEKQLNSEINQHAANEQMQMSKSIKLLLLSMVLMLLSIKLLLSMVGDDIRGEASARAG